LPPVTADERIDTIAPAGKRQGEHHGTGVPDREEEPQRPLVNVPGRSDPLLGLYFALKSEIS
jgi:hypothetical protein